MIVSVNTIITCASLFSAIIAILSIVFSAYRWYLRQNKQDEDIRQLKCENMLIVSALCACLDGLEQLGANHRVTKAREKLDEYINEQAHGANTNK